MFTVNIKLTLEKTGPIVCALLLLGHCDFSVAQRLGGQVVGITDGDTFTLLTREKEQIRIRVAEIDAPERAQPYGNRSRQALSDLIFNKEVSVDVQVVDRYGRPVGRPFVGNKDISAEMIRIGAAWVYRSYSDDQTLYDLERTAKAKGLGIWGLDEHERMPPWEWRKKDRTSAPGNAELEAFKCGEKTYCREMISCDEARFHLRSCGLTRLDGDGDSIPCETLCR